MCSSNACLCCRCCCCPTPPLKSTQSLGSVGACVCLSVCVCGLAMSGVVFSNGLSHTVRPSTFHIVCRSKLRLCHVSLVVLPLGRRVIINLLLNTSSLREHLPNVRVVFDGPIHCSMIECATLCLTLGLALGHAALVSSLGVLYAYSKSITG